MSFLVKVEGSESFEVAKVTVEHVAGGVMERKYCFPNAFVLDYKEEFGDVEGTGTFTLVLRQKKDKIASVAVEGNYSA